MKKERLLELAGVEQINEENIVKLAIDITTTDMIDLVAEHLWHAMMADGDVDEFFDDIKRELETKKKRSQ